MRRFMTIFLPLILAIWPAAGVSTLLTEPHTTASNVAFCVAYPFAWFLMVPVAGLIGGLIGFEPHDMNHLYGSGWAAGMRVMRRPGRWHHT